MSAPEFSIPAGDLGPAFTKTLFDVDGVTPIDLTGATIAFRMAIVDGVSPIIGTAGTASAVGTPTLGNMQYAWHAGDTDVPGIYEGEVTVTKAGVPRTFPPDRTYVIEIRPRV